MGFVASRYSVILITIMEKPRFVDDINIKNALTGILLRSPVVSGLLKEIQTPKLPFNVSLITVADIPGQKFCSVGKSNEQDGQLKEYFEIPIFPEKELSWYGQPVAMLVGPDPAKLRELAEQCTILADTENPEQQEKSKQQTESKIIIERSYSTGSIAEAFEKAVMVIEGRYYSALQDPWPSDPPGAIAVPGNKNSMTIHTATQWPGHVHNSVAQCLNIKTSFVNVEPARLEIHLDSKIWYPSLLACQAAVGAKIRGKPVKLILKRDEDFLFSPKSAGAEIFLQSALNKQGHILGTKLHVSVNVGAYGIFAREILDRIALSALGAYNHVSIELEGHGRISHIPPAGPTIGFGHVQGFFAAERHASLIADTLGIDPAEWRKKVFLSKEKKLAIGVEINNPPLEELIDRSETMSDYRRKWAAYELLRKNRREHYSSENKSYEPLRGIGVSLAYQGNSLLYDHRGQKSYEEGVELTLEKDGVLEIRTALPWGDNQIRIWHSLAAKTLGVEKIRIATKAEMPKNVPESGPASLSRGINIITELVEKACIAIRKQRFRDPLPITVHRYYRPSTIPSWNDMSIEEKIDKNALGCLSWGSAVVEAEIDPVDYIPRIRGIWLCIDGGTILSEKIAKKSISTATLEALSWAMQEKVVYQNGRIDERSVKEYSIQTDDYPPINVDFLWSEGKSRGIGELPFALIPAAYAQALSQALDCHFNHYPVDTGDIWKAVQHLSAKVEP